MLRCTWFQATTHAEEAAAVTRGNSRSTRAPHSAPTHKLTIPPSEPPHQGEPLDAQRLHGLQQRPGNVPGW